MLFNSSTFNFNSFEDIFDTFDFNTGASYYLIITDTNDNILHVIPFYCYTKEWEEMYYLIEDLFNNIYPRIGEFPEDKSFRLEILLDSDFATPVK